MRILWLSNAPWAPSGYGQQTALFVPRIAALGHDVAIAANHGIQGVKTEWEGFDVYPCDPDWGNRTVQTFAEDWNADLVIALCDAWVMHPEMWETVQMAIWAPVDHYPVPEPVLKVLAASNVKPIAMSRYGEAAMNDAHARLGVYLEPLYVPHGVDTSLFKPNPSEKQAVRRELGFPEDCFLVGMVAANQSNPFVPRKAFPQAFHAFSMLAKAHDDACMFVHTRPKPAQGGSDLFDLAQAVSISPDRLKFTPNKAWDLGMRAETVASLYQAFDVLLSPSMGEGFGIPIVEAQACGVPVIVSNHSAMTELGEHGWLVSGDPWWYPQQKAFLTVPFIGEIYNALEDAYQKRDDAELRARARDFAVQYDADTVAERFWVPALQALDRPKEVGPIMVKGGNGLNRQQRRQLEKAGKK